MVPLVFNLDGKQLNTLLNELPSREKINLCVVNHIEMTQF